MVCKMKIQYHSLYCCCFISGHSVKKVIVVLKSYFLSGTEVGFCADVLQCAKSLREKKLVFTLKFLRSLEAFFLTNTKQNKCTNWQKHI